MRTLVALLLLSLPVAAQTPQIDYSKYGSAARQLIVYNNVKQHNDALERRKERKAREDREERREIIVVRPTREYMYIRPVRARLW